MKKKEKKSQKEILDDLLYSPDGRKRAKKLGLEKKFDKEIERLRKKLPHVSFRERSILGFDGLAKQKPFTLEEARAQSIHIKMRSSHTIDKKGEIKHLLKMYHPNWTQEQIEDGFDEIQRIILRESKGCDVKQAIANYLKKISEKEILDELLFSPDGRKRAKKIGLEKEFEKEIKRLRKKLPYDVSFREMSILGWDVLAKQKPSTLEEKRAQIERLRKSMEDVEAIKKMTMDEKRSRVCYIVRLAYGRTIAQQAGIENLFDEYLEDIKMRLPKIFRYEWVFLRIQEFASKKDVTDEEKKLHEEYLHYGNMEETFEQYIQMSKEKANNK